MHALLIGLAAALVACIAAFMVFFGVLVRRNSKRSDARVSASVEELEARMGALARELTEALRRAEEETGRNRFLGEIGSTLLLEDVLAATLEAAVSLPPVDAALLHLDAGEGEERPIVSASGFEGDEPDGLGLFGPPAAWGARAVELRFRYPDEGAARGVRSAVGVPLLGESGRIGWLAVFSRRPQTRVGDEGIVRLEELAERAAPALANARRFQEAQRLADLDSLTGLHNRRYFHETLGREVVRAQRYGRRLSLVIVDVDEFKEVNDRIGHLAGDDVLAETARRVGQVVRAADVPCRVGGDELGVILPEAGLDDARLLVQRIQHAVSSQPVAQAGRVRVSAGVAELQPNDDPTSLFERADRALYAAKHARKTGLNLAAAD